MTTYLRASPTKVRLALRRAGLLFTHADARRGRHGRESTLELTAAGRESDRLACWVEWACGEWGCDTVEDRRRSR